MFEHNGLYIDPDGDIRCRCTHRQIKAWDIYKYERHFCQKKHMKYEDERDKECVHQAAIDEMIQEEESQESVRLTAAGTRSTCSVHVDTPFREGFVEMLMKCAIPIARAEKMRVWVEKKCQRSLGHFTKLPQHIPKLLKKETDLQELILKSVKYIGIIFDATPRQGDFFAMLARYVVLEPVKKRAVAHQQLIHCAAVQGSLNQYTQLGEVAKGLHARGIKNERAVVEMADGCYTNGAAHEMGNNIADAAGDVKRFISICLSHCASNAGKLCYFSSPASNFLHLTIYVLFITSGQQASFVMLDHFWSLVQKVFAHSDGSKEEWYKVTEIPFPTHSNIRWYSKFDVLEVFFKYFPDLLTVVTNGMFVLTFTLIIHYVSHRIHSFINQSSVANKGYSSKNSSKLLHLLLDEAKMWYLKIELSAYVDVLGDLRNLCYFLEGDGTDMPFKVGERLDSLAKLYPGGKMKDLPSTEALIKQVCKNCLFIQILLHCIEPTFCLYHSFVHIVLIRLLIGLIHKA